MTSIYCHHPAVICTKESGAWMQCQDCGALIENMLGYTMLPSVRDSLDERATENGQVRSHA
jgi:hypothetical protein